MDSKEYSDFILFKSSSRRALSARASTAKRTGLILVLILFAACGEEHPATIESQAILLDSSSTIINASAALEFRVTPASAQLDDIRAMKTGWRRNDQPVFDRGFVSDAIWIRMPIRNGTDLTRWYLTLRNTRLDYVDFYLVSDRGIQSLSGGDRRPLASEAPAAYPVFRFTLAQAESGTLYVRIKTDTHISFPVRLYGPEEFGVERDRNVLASRIDQLIAKNRSSGKVPKKGPVTNIDTESVLAQLTAYFVQERPYLEEDLSLTKVAQYLGLRTDQLSAVLNREMKTSFNSFVNEYRFRQARRLIQERPDMNLLEIAFECGFGSYASFHRTFRALADQSPADFRRALEKIESSPAPEQSRT